MSGFPASVRPTVPLHGRCATNSTPRWAISLNSRAGMPATVGTIRTRWPASSLSRNQPIALVERCDQRCGAGGGRFAGRPVFGCSLLPRRGRTVERTGHLASIGGPGETNRHLPDKAGIGPCRASLHCDNNIYLIENMRIYCRIWRRRGESGAGMSTPSQKMPGSCRIYLHKAVGVSSFPLYLSDL